jgi:hypothetical protein
MRSRRKGAKSGRRRTLARMAPARRSVAVAHGGQLVGQLVVTLGDLGTRLEYGSLPERFDGTRQRRHGRRRRIVEQWLLLGDEGGGSVGGGA